MHLYCIDYVIAQWIKQCCAILKIRGWWFKPRHCNPDFGLITQLIGLTGYYRELVRRGKYICFRASYESQKRMHLQSI